MVESINEASDLDKLKELVRRTGEFIAYFEIAETKMLEWKHNIELKLSQQEKLFNKHLETIHAANNELAEILTQAGAARWRLAAEQALASGEKHLSQLQTLSQQSIDQLTQQHQQQTRQSTSLINQVESACTTTINKIEQAVESANLTEFKQAAQNTQEQFEKTSSESMSRSERLIKSIQMKSAIAAIIASTITALTIGLYMSDEMPWEIHKHAMHERSAGKVLLNAWPNLSQNERNKIIAYNHNQPLE